jgi:hypothetical protein
VSDTELAEFIIGHSINITFPEDFWPNEGGQWAGEPIDTCRDKKHFQDRLCVKFLLTSGPKSRKFGEHADIPITHNNNSKSIDVSVRRAIREHFPSAITCADLTKVQHPQGTSTNKVITRSRDRKAKLATLRETALLTAPIHLPHNHKSKLVHSPEKCIMPALFAFACSTMLNSLQTDLEFQSKVQPVEPKNERDARASPQKGEWLLAEEIELKTIWKMGTFEIVDLPVNVIPLPSRFTYRIKRELSGKIGKFKARLVARGDMQTEDEYSTTYAPTSRFTAIRTIISIATQENLSLKHWDITGAFMTADIDTELYLDLPPGYHLPPGKSIKLKKSLYG